jgi:Spy/CpxP family protein refolding chaperone
MKRPLLILLVFSLALNTGFSAAAFYRWFRVRHSPAGRSFLAEVLRGGRPFSGAPHRRGMPDHPPMHGRMPGEARERWVEHHMEHLDTLLELGPEQRGELQAVLEESRGRAASLMDEIATRRGEVRALLSAAEIDSITLRSTVVEISRLQSQLDSLLVETLLRERRMLRPDQCDAFSRWLFERRQPRAKP